MIHIYLITNEVTGKYYVGQTSKTIKNRFRGHLSSAKANKATGCRRLNNSIRKYGPGAFSTQQLATADTTEAGNTLETLWIMCLDSTNPSTGYNLTLGGDGTRGIVCPEDKKKKISESLMGHEQKPNSGSFQKGHGLGTHLSEIHKESLRKARTGKSVSEETRNRLSTLRLGSIPWNKGLKGVQKSAFKGHTRTEETKKRISESKRGSVPWNKGLKGIQSAWNKGLKTPLDVRQKQAEAAKHRKA